MALLYHVSVTSTMICRTLAFARSPRISIYTVSHPSCLQPPPFTLFHRLQLSCEQPFHGVVFFALINCLYTGTFSASSRPHGTCLCCSACGCSLSPSRSSHLCRWLKTEAIATGSGPGWLPTKVDEDHTTSGSEIDSSSSVEAPAAAH